MTLLSSDTERMRPMNHVHAGLRRGVGGGQRGRQICSTSKLEAARGLFKGRWQQKRAY